MSGWNSNEANERQKQQWLDMLDPQHLLSDDERQRALIAALRTARFFNDGAAA